MPTNLPGSKILPAFASYINVIGTSTGLITRLNVASWDTEEQVKTGPNAADSGSAGYPIRRVTGFDSSIPLTIWWDAANSPRTLLNFGGMYGCALQLGISTLANYQAYGFNQQQFFILLSGMLTRFRTRANSRGLEGEEGIILADAVVLPNATRLFLLPDENAAYAIEVQRLTALGQLNALAQFSVMQ